MDCCVCRPDLASVYVELGWCGTLHVESCCAGVCTERHLAEVDGSLSNLLHQML